MKVFFLWVIALSLLTYGCQKKHPAAVRLRAIYDQPCFSEICSRAAQDEETFNSFKTDPFFTLICERRSFDEGALSLIAIEREWPEFAQHCEQFRENDQLGAPRVYDYGKWGVFSPTTLSYVEMAVRAQRELGDLSGKKILQVGAGYGGLCKILSDLHVFQSYTIVDFQPQIDLARSYLNRLGISGVTFCTWQQLSNQGYDCVVSEGQFSELCKEEQLRLIDQIFKHVDTGCIWGYVVPQHFGVSSLGPDLIERRLANQGKEISLIKGGRGNYQLYWTIK